MLRHVRNLSGRAEARPSENSCPSQRKPIVGRLPQAQPHQLVIKTIVDLWPKSAHDVFAGRRRFPKIIRLQIKMSISPGAERFLHRVPQGCKIVECSFSFVISSTHRRFSDIKMAVTTQVIASAKE